jgi:hypothetical protein
MNRLSRAAVVGAALALVSVCAGGQPQANAPSLAGRLLAAERAALQDPDAGRLYPQAAALLAAAHGLPDSIELIHPPIPPEQAQPQPAPAEPAAPPKPVAPPWPQVVDGPVVDDETLAYTRFQAGDYAGAAALYSRLHDQAPDDLYLTQMLFLSKRDAGDAQGAAPLLEELKAKPDTHDWAEWVSAMAALGNDAKEAK